MRKGIMFLRKIKPDNSIFETVFLIIYSIIIFMNIMSSSQVSQLPSWGRANTIVMGLSMATLIITFFLFGQVDKRTFILAVIMALVCLAVRQQSDQGKNIIFFIAVSFFGIYTDRRRVVRQYIIVASATIALIVILYYSGAFYTDFIGRNDENVTRVFLGFNYTNYAPTYLFYITLAYFFIKKKPINLLETGIIVGLDILLYRLTATQAVFFEVLAFVGVLWLIRIFPGVFKLRIFRFIAVAAMPFFAIAIFVLTKIYTPGSTFLSNLNRLLTGRLALGQQALEKYKIGLFGTRTQWETSIASRADGTYFYVDSSFLNIALTFGIIMLLFVLIGYMILAARKHKQRALMACAAIVFLAIHAFAGERLFELGFNPTIIYLGASFIPLHHLTAIGHSGDFIMEHKEKNERQISLKTLFLRVIRHWKLILIVSAIIGAGAAGLKMVSGYGSLSDSENAVAAQEKYDKELADYKNNQKTYKDTISTMKDTMQSKLDYLCNSILIQLDPNKVSYAYNDYFITSDDFAGNASAKDTDHVGGQILDAYASYLTNEIDWEPLAKEMDTEPQYLMELAGVGKDYATGRLTISAKHNNPEDAARVLDYIVDHANDYEDSLKKEFGGFTVIKRTPVESEIMDSSLQNLINNKATELKNLENSLKQLEQSYNKLEPPAVPSSLGKSAAAKNAITFGAKIFGISLAAMAVLLALIILISRRVLSADELNKTFNFREIAIFRSKDDTGNNSASKYDIISECLRHYSGGAKNILLVGSAPKKNVNKLLSELAKRLKDTSVDYVENVDDNRESIEKLKAADAVVFVEKVGRSGYRRIEDNFDRVINWDKPIAGSIVY